MKLWRRKLWGTHLKDKAWTFKKAEKGRRSSMEPEETELQGAHVHRIRDSKGLREKRCEPY